uniref:RRM domain-containing protein n=1 Tax=Glossina palpalis gambiensis TaxID=67801 RepID=A0A1B0BMD9_9MUSC
THLWHVKSSKTKNNIDNRLEPDERRHVYNYIGNENGYEVILISNEMLYECKDCRVVRDPQTLKSKGYGFVSFVKKSVSIT